MKFKLPYDRTLVSTCGISIEFKANEYHLVPPAMYQQVRDAGGVPDGDEPTLTSGAVPSDVIARRAALFIAFKTIVARNVRDDFTAGNMPNAAAVTREIGWAPQPKEHLQAWNLFLATSGESDKKLAPAPAPAPAPAEAELEPAPAPPAPPAKTAAKKRGR